MSCTSTNKSLCGKQTCTICWTRSFATYPKAKYWSIKNDVGPEFVTKFSNKFYIFNCDKCDNEFKAMPNAISRGIWCSY